MIARIQVRRDTTVNWEFHNPPLRLGEIGLDITNNKFKVGGESDSQGNFPRWNDLNYELGQWQGHTRTVQIEGSDVDIHDIKYGFQDDEGDVYINNDLFVNNDVKIEGNLTVRGDTTTVNTVNSTFKDNIIELNLDVDDTGNYNENLESGIQVNRGILDGDTESSFQRIYWQENDLKWVIDSDLNVLGDLYSNGTKLWSINSFSDIWFNGTVGIGDFDQTDALDSLHILNEVEDSDPGIRIQNDEQSWAIYTRGSDSDKLKFVDISSTELGTTPFQIETNAPNNSLYIQGGTESTGNVGIGTNVPDVRLEVAKANTSTGLGTGGLLQLTNTSGSAFDQRAEILFKNTGQVTSAISSSYTSFSSPEYGGELVFATKHHTDTEIQEQMRIDSSGTVLIGNSSSISNSNLLEVKGSQYNYLTNQGISISPADGNSSQQIYTNYSSGGSEQSLALGTFSNRSNQLFLRTNGNVGIGTSSPSAELEISNNASSGSGATLRLSNVNGAVSAGTSAGEIEFYKGDTSGGAGLVGYIKSVASDLGEKYDLAFGAGNSSTLTERMYIKSDGKVGIGTSAPSAKLHATGDIVAQNATNPTVSANDNGTLGASDKSVYMRYDTTNDVGVLGSFHNGKGAKNLVLNQLGGNVGIGTNGPSSKLHLNGSSGVFAKITDSASEGTIETGLVLERSAANTDYRVLNNGTFRVQTATDASTWTDIMTITSAGNLSITGDMNFQNWTYNGTSNWSNTSGKTRTLRFGEFSDNTAGFFGPSTATDSNSKIDLGTSDGKFRNAHFSGTVNAGVLTEGGTSLINKYLSSVTVNTGTGIVGGATLTPSSTSVNISLDFAELADMDTDISGTTEFILLNGNTESRKAASEIKLSNFNIDIETSKWTDSTSVTGAIYRSSGKVGIRESSPSAMLDINSDITGGTNEDLRIINTANTEQWHRGILVLHPNIENKNAGTIMFGNSETAGNSGHISFRNSAVDGEEKVSIGIYNKNDLLNIQGNGNVGIGKSNPSEKLDVVGNITATGTITSTSDISVKENIELISNPIEKVKELSGYTFNKKGEDVRLVGLIAQEVEKVLPEAVHENQEGLKSLAYGNMVALLVECIKKQDERIETLEKTIEKLKL